MTEQVFDNLYYGTELKKGLTVAFTELYNILVDHSGPFASNCVLGSRWRQHNDIDEMTKDGIKILRHLIVSDAPMDRFAARMARFVGVAVDHRCHDGTTTSMLLFSRLALMAIEKIDQAYLSADRYLWVKVLDKCFDFCLSFLEEIKITEDDILERAHQLGIKTTLTEVRAAMAYHMAMISSKGDDDLSSKISYVVKSCPKKIYGMFNNSPLATEMKDAYILNKQEHDLAIDCNLGNVQDYNHRNGSQYLSEDAVIFMTGNDIVTSSMEALFLKAFISDHPNHRGDLQMFGMEHGWDHYHEGRRHLLIMAPMINETNLIEVINIFNMENPNCRISWINVQVHPRMRVSLNKTMHYLAGVPLFPDVMVEDASKSLIGLHTGGVRAHLIGHTMQLFHLYKKDGEIYHPLYRDPEAFEPYTRFCRETEELIEFANQNVSNPALDNKELTYLTSLYRSLTCQEIYNIDVGGSIHDQYANQTVYEDAIGAALSAVNEGIVLGGYGHLASLFGRMIDYEGNSEIPRKFEEAFLDIILSSLRVDKNDQLIKDRILTSHPDKWSYIVADMQRYVQDPHSRDYIEASHFGKSAIEMFLECSPNRPFLLQAFGGYHEQFRRFKAMLPKLANTTHLTDMRVKDPDNLQ